MDKILLQYWNLYTHFPLVVCCTSSVCKVPECKQWLYPLFTQVFQHVTICKALIRKTLAVVMVTSMLCQHISSTALVNLHAM